MNARNHNISLKVDVRQIRDAVLCILNTTILHRVVGKYKYSQNDMRVFTLGSIGLEEALSREIDLTYVRVNSPQLIQYLEQQVDEYIEYLQSGNPPDYGYDYGFSEEHSAPGPPAPSPASNLCLEFYQKKRRLVKEECVPWEIWNIRLNVINAADLNVMREEVGENLGEIVMNICNTINQGYYLPPTPTMVDLPLIFDDRFSDIQPYLFRLVYKKDPEKMSISNIFKNVVNQAANVLNI